MFASLPLFLTFFSCSKPQPVAELPGPLTEEMILEHVEVLASDAFGGRTPGTKYEEMTVAYIREAFEKIGVKPGMPDGTYFQAVPLMGQVTNKAELRLSGKMPEIALSYQDDMMAWPTHLRENVSIKDAELVYVGYGITAPEEDWDDFKGEDLSGKILVFKNYNPVTYEDRFEGGNRLYYGRWTYKFEQAAKQGALGALIIHTDKTAGYGWDVVRNSWSLERFFVYEEEAPSTKFEGWLTHEQSSDLFERAGLDLEEMLDHAEQTDFRPVPLEGVQLHADIRAQYRSIEGQNVVGKIKGSDPEKAKEAVVFSAHHDHLGYGTPVDGDSIFNGALDNAAGVSYMINLARLYALEKEEIRRSLYFVAVTAEESGLLGSRFFADNSPVHPGKITANINLDAANIFGRTNDMVIVGLGRTDLDDIIFEEAALHNRDIRPDPQPEQGIYYRSDHFSFARKGIPAIYPRPGTDFIDKPDNYNDQVAEYRTKIYHTVHDRIHDWWDLAGAVEDIALIYQIGLRVANDNKIRQWVPGDEFEQARFDALREAKSLQ